MTISLDRSQPNIGERRKRVTVELSPALHRKAVRLAGEGSISRLLARGLALALKNPPSMSGRKSPRAPDEIQTQVFLSQTLYTKAKLACIKGGTMQQLLVYGLGLVNGRGNGSDA